jgi:putative tryptophan/tyrosine transport system substrate-binding protein
MLDVRRREFITLLGGTLPVWPLATRAQQAARIRRIVFLHAIAEDDPEGGARVAAFRQGLATLGWMENSNVQIEHRFASGDFSRIRALATELTSSAPDLIVASGAPVVAELKEARV